MKKNFYATLVPALMLGFVTCGVVACGDDDDDDVKHGTEQPGDDGNKETSEPEQIVVTVDANGNVKGDHRFSAIDDSNFLIDDIKYTAESGDLFVTGFDKAYFKGEAKIITTLDYQGRRLEVKGIANEAFRGCNALTAISIPSSVTNIGEHAFSGCTGLTSITIPNGVTSIGNYAFYGCTGLTSITIPNSVTRIGDFAFYDCTGLKDIYCYAVNPPTARYSFERDSLSEVILHVPAESIDKYKLSASDWGGFGSIVAIE